ncbi:hypothetical protein H2248_012150 [Termitomyces sp. 'cryptogamus']|nr:hypothetical protein H2248_012150 [Termitomyces sp. 'cryptogamus']
MAMAKLTAMHLTVRSLEEGWMNSTSTRQMKTYDSGTSLICISMVIFKFFCCGRVAENPGEFRYLPRKSMGNLVVNKLLTTRVYINMRVHLVLTSKKAALSSSGTIIVGGDH